MPKNPKLDATKKQTALLRDRLKNAAPESSEAKRLGNEVARLERLVDMYTKQDKQAERIADFEQKHAEQNRKDDTRIKVIVGAAVLSDAGLKPETRAAVIVLLGRAVKAPRDREFLKTKGWL
jgi:protein subunit release factor A